MRLTADLITNSLSYINPLLERELDLRGAFFISPVTVAANPPAGHKIPAIENLGVAGVRAPPPLNNQGRDANERNRAKTQSTSQTTQ
jgi:hypothetical protein